MVQKNNGYAMVIVLIVVTVLFLLSASLATLINGEISLSSNNYNAFKKQNNGG